MTELRSHLAALGVLACALLCASAPLAAQSDSKVSSSSNLDTELADFQFTDLRTALQTMPAGASRDYFLGVLANREGRDEDSIHLLEGVLPSIRTAQPARAAIALEALADDYVKLFRYDDASRTYDDLLTHFAAQLTPAKLQGTKDDTALAHVLRGAPGQTVDFHGPIRLPTERNIIGSLVTKLTVNGVANNWLLDTGANLSVVSKSFAARLGLKPLPGFAQTMSGITGIENPLQAAILPSLDVGGATLHNVVIMILDDANLNINLGTEKYQIDGVIGFPVFQSLGAITFTHDGWFEAGDSAQRNATGAAMYMKLLTPVIECGVQGDSAPSGAEETLPFSFDTGAGTTELSIRYFQKFRGEMATWKEAHEEDGGAGGTVKRNVYLQRRLDLNVGDKIVTLVDVSILPTLIGSDVDELYGNLGQDLVANFESFTVDFSKMTFSLGARLPAAPAAAPPH